MVYRSRSEPLGAELFAVKDLRVKLNGQVTEPEWKTQQSLDGAVYRTMECLSAYEPYAAGVKLQGMYESPWRAVRFAVASAFASELKTLWTPSELQKYADKLASELRDELGVVRRNYRAGYEAANSIRTVLTDSIQLFEDSHASSAFEIIRWIAKDKHLDPVVRKEARAYIKETSKTA